MNCGAYFSEAAFQVSLKQPDVYSKTLKSDKKKDSAEVMPR